MSHANVTTPADTLDPLMLRAAILKAASKHSMFKRYSQQQDDILIQLPRFPRPTIFFRIVDMKSSLEEHDNALYERESIGLYLENGSIRFGMDECNALFKEHFLSKSRAMREYLMYIVQLQTAVVLKRTPIEIEVFLETLDVEGSDNYLEYTENTGVAFRAQDLRSFTQESGCKDGTVGVYMPGNGVVFGFEASVIAILQRWRKRLTRRKSLADMHGILPSGNDDTAALKTANAGEPNDDIPLADDEDAVSQGVGAGAGAGGAFKRDATELSVRSIKRNGSESSIRSVRKEPAGDNYQSFKRDHTEASIRSVSRTRDASENSIRSGRASGEKPPLSRRKSEELTKKILLVPTPQDCARVFGMLLSHHAPNVVGGGKATVKAREACAEFDSSFGAKLIRAPRFVGKGPDDKFENFTVEFFTERTSASRSPEFSRTIITVKKDKVSVDTRLVGQLGVKELCGAKCILL